MWENEATQHNLRTLASRGVQIVLPASGHLACGDSGAGKLEDVSVIAERALEALGRTRDMEGLRVLVTWGEGEVDKTTLPALLPHGFGPRDLPD